MILRWAVVSCAAVCSLVVPLHPLQSQGIPRDEYLTYIPLEYPVLVWQTDASAIWGSTSPYSSFRNPEYN